MQNNSRQISGNNPKGKPILSVITKRTYTLDNLGNCSLAEEQPPLIENVEVHPDHKEIVTQDIDLYPYKPYTDIVLKGKAYNSQKSSSFQASIEIANQNVDMQIIGNRKVSKNERGKFVFSEAEIIEEIPLEYQYAYGGKDLLAEKPIRDQFEQEESLSFLGEVFDPLEGSPFRYPRNPAGKGYIIEAHNDTIDNLELPNIEDPYNLLIPETLLCSSPLDWYKMPVPRCTDWISPGWFPRIAYFGMYPLPDGLDEEVYEIKNKWADRDLLKSQVDVKKAKFSFRACNGASLGLQSSYLNGGESCRLTNIHPKKREFIFDLPKDKPEIKVDGRNGKMLKTSPVLHLIQIEPDINRLTMVWCGSARAIRPYSDEELQTMPFEVNWQ